MRGGCKCHEVRCELIGHVTCSTVGTGSAGEAAWVDKTADLSRLESRPGSTVEILFDAVCLSSNTEALKARGWARPFS
jgi:hypothetical protein